MCRRGFMVPWGPVPRDGHARRRNATNARVQPRDAISGVAETRQKPEQRPAEAGADASVAHLVGHAPVADGATAEHALLGGVGGELRAQAEAGRDAVAADATVGDPLGR